MNKTASNKMSRLELYLKNMDLLGINPSISVSGINLQLSEKSDINRLFKLLNDWCIQELYLFEHIESIIPLINFYQNTANKSHLKDIKIALNLHINEENFIHTNRDHLDRLFQTKLFCTNLYHKRQKVWGEDVFYFYGYEPEIYTIHPGDKFFEAEIKYPEDVIAIFQWRYSDSEEFQVKNCSDILSKLDAERGILKLKAHREKSSKIIVLRTCKVVFNNRPQYWLNFVNPKNFNLACEKHQQKIIEMGITEVDTIFDLNVLLPGMNFDFLPNLIYTKEKQSQLITNQPILDLTLKKYMAAHPESNKANLELVNLYSDYMREQFLSQFNHKKKDQLFIDVDHPLSKQLLNSVPVVVRIEMDRFLPETKYTLNTCITIRKLVNAVNKTNDCKIQASIDHILNTRHSFNDKKYIIDYLTVTGINHFNFSISGDIFENKEKPLAAINNWDPNFSAYSDWFAYLHQLGHFMKLGIRRPEALLLYPGSDEDLELFERTINELKYTGLDYHIIDFDTFNDHFVCPVEDGNFILFNHNYRILILPAILNIPIECMQKINKFFTEGGIVLALGRLPAHTRDGKKDTLLKQIKKEIWPDVSDTQSTLFKQHESGGLGYFQKSISRLRNILTDLDKNLRIHIKSSNPGIVYQLREHQENYYLLVMNTDQFKTTHFNIESKYLGRPYCWDFNTAESHPYADWYIRDKKLIMRLRLAPGETRLFVIDKKHSLKIFQLYDSSLDGYKIIQQDEQKFKMDGWQRKEGSFSIIIQKAGGQKQLDYKIKEKLPMLSIGNSGWYLDSDHFKGQVSLGDQSYPFPYQSAVLTYHKLIVLKKDYLNKQKLFLDLGQLHDWCTLSINNEYVGRRIFAPWIFDVSKFMKAGENKISIQIANRLSNMLAENNKFKPANYFVQSYGLLGPVRIIPYNLVTLEN
ncbi:MAG: hypothetical protein JW956_00230 [Calditrichaceae bacterium]|nr:hypothetical protein [Calditrichaceae bacterium]